MYSDIVSLSLSMDGLLMLFADRCQKCVSVAVLGKLEREKEIYKDVGKQKERRDIEG